MNRWILGCLLLTSSIVKAQTFSPMKTEMESFLSSMPVNIQKHQAEAIQMAINGNFKPLNDVRNARRPLVDLPADVDTLRVRDDMLLFYPAEKQACDTFPLLVYLHGGGWTFGSINSCASFCATLASAGVIVAAVDYPLAPEHTQSYITESVANAVMFAIDNASEWGSSAALVSLGGDSSGGNLALSTALLLPEQLRSLVIFYPVTDARTEATSGSPYSTGFGNDAVLMEAFRDAYLGKKRVNQLSPHVSPILASDEQLAKLPPILMVAAECDILNRQGKEFAGRLSSLGNDIRYIELPGTTHLFITVPGQPTAFHKSIQLTADFLR